MSDLRWQSALLSLLLVLALAVAPAPVAADSDSMFDDLTDSEDDGYLSAGLGVVKGWASGISASVSSAFSSDETTADDAATEFQTAVNDNSAELSTWVNNRTTATTDYDVVAITFELEDESETRYLTANVSNESYQDVSVVNSTDRTVDQNCTFEDHAARSAGDEVGVFVEKFAADDKNVTSDYLGRMYGEYNGDVECSFNTGEN